jgi:hypothetical protein
MSEQEKLEELERELLKAMQRVSALDEAVARQREIVNRAAKSAQADKAEAVSNPEVCAGSLTPAQKTVTKSVDDYENQNYR